MSQTQCSNCGGFRASLLKKERVFSDYQPYTPKQRRTSIFIGLALTFLLLGCGTIWCLGVKGPDLVAILATTLMTILLWFFILAGIKAGDPKTIGVISSFECNLCGYLWTERPGQPKPVIQVRPDLIAKGEQRLREAEERRRRDGEAYEAWQRQQDE